jgi:hypothetical protein
MNLPRTWLLLTLALSAASLTGCSAPALVRVRPWERGALAGYAMNPDRDALAAMMREHVYFSREAASGGRGVGGSGCGCN